MSDDERAAVATFNHAHPIGSEVRYWTGPREGDGKRGRTCTTAHLLGGHTAVVWVSGHSACIALSHVASVEG